MLDVCPAVCHSHNVECAFKERAGYDIAKRFEKGTAQSATQGLKMHHR